MLIFVGIWCGKKTTRLRALKKLTSGDITDNISVSPMALPYGDCFLTNKDPVIKQRVCIIECKALRGFFFFVARSVNACPLFKNRSGSRTFASPQREKC